MITIVMICYWQAYELAKACHLPDKFKGNKEEKNEGKKESKKEGQEMEEGGRSEEEQGKEGGEGRVGSCREGATIDQRMVGRREGWIRFHKSTYGLPVHRAGYSHEILGLQAKYLLEIATFLFNIQSGKINRVNHPNNNAIEILYSACLVELNNFLCNEIVSWQTKEMIFCHMISFLFKLFLLSKDVMFCQR